MTRSIFKLSDPPSIIRGGAGNDRSVWQDNDTNRDLYDEALKVFGGGGADVFDFGYYHSRTIQDFQAGTDKVDLTVHLGRETTTFTELQTMITDTVNGAVLKLDFNMVHGFDIVFKGVLTSEFIDGDFIL